MEPNLHGSGNERKGALLQNYRGQTEGTPDRLPPGSKDSDLGGSCGHVNQRCLASEAIEFCCIPGFNVSINLAWRLSSSCCAFLFFVPPICLMFEASSGQVPTIMNRQKLLEDVAEYSRIVGATRGLIFL